MSYIGRKPTVGNFQICDAISVVNGQAAYTMQVGSVNVIPQSANHMIVSLNGTIQKPNSSFTVSGSTITFASNLATGDVIDFIQILGDVLDLGVPSDATVTTAKLADSSVTTAKLAADAVTESKIADGAVESEHLNNNIISGQTELTTTPADTDEFLISDAGTIKRIDYSHIKGSSINTAFVAKAWINLDGTGTIAIRDDEGFSSVTDNGTGDYTLTFDTAFANDDYCAVLGNSRANNGSFNDNTGIQIGSQATTNIRIYTWKPFDQNVVDHEIANVAIFGEQ